MAEFRVTTGRDGIRSFGEHDDRWTDSGGSGKFRGRGSYRGNRRSFNNKKSYGFSSYSRRSSGSPFRSRGRGRGGPNPRSRVDDEGDDVMGGEDAQTSHSRFNPYGRPSKGGFHGKNSRYDSNSNKRTGGSMGTFKRLGLPIDSRRDDGEPQWFKIVIPWGKKADKDFILKNINNHVDVPFVPTYFHYEDNTAIFFVNDKRAAESIRGITKRITMPTGYKMTILVKNSIPPNIPMGTEEVDKLKVVMSNRYDPTTKALNLSSLHTDKELSQDNLYMNLARPQVMTNVVKIIQENIPELCCLDMSDNKLFSLDHLAALVSSTGDLKVLNLGKNKITHVEEVRKLKSWKIESLTLDGNPLCDKFNDQTSYISAVRKVFPKVMKLDGKDLPPPITFDIEARTDLPKSKANYFPNAEVQGPVVKFLKDYFTVYDAADRSGLSGAYHEQAMFSLSVAYNGAVQYKQSSLSSYIDESRNLARQHKDSSRKHKLLKKGSLIVPQLCLLPKTSHDPNSFIVDCNFMSSAMMSFTVQGVYKEVDSKQDKQPIRAFSRTFVTVPGGSGMLVVNDILTITNASPDQIQAAFKTPAPTPSSSPVPQTSPSSPFEGLGLTEVQQQMIVSFIAESRMNSEWSAKCLAENGWDYAKAGQNFLALQQQGKIPPEAFNK
ncbi:nuclear RNA export factor 1-like [Mercenaria mercenaria]|uniref:nuclear RNA export factor 1-like n=1 Tax=Mercenaria mercenaria TaxID=6596 RepID=UPI00234E8DFD|nr:nuclear RNA export factor 1-like [Mercenaria mercenaria]